METCIILNPTAKGGKAESIIRRLGTLGGRCQIQRTVAAGSGTKIARESVLSGVKTLVSAGGDGTLNEVLNGIGQVPDGFALTRLGILPLGTANVFAKEVGIPMNPTQAWRVIEDGFERTIDLPSAKFQVNGEHRNQYFAQLGGAGLDSRAIELVQWNLKRCLGPLAYVIAGLRALSESQPHLEVTDHQTTATGELVLIGNGQHYGGRFRLFPKANLSDGLIHACVFSSVRLRDLPRRVWGLLTQRLPQQRGVTLMAGRTLTLTGPTHVKFELEGDLTGNLPVTFRVAPSKLRIIAPTQNKMG